MIRRPPLARTILAVALAASACGDSTYQKAAVGAGIAVAATGVYRAVTGGCWANCQAGLVCNEKKGICEPGECAPACAVGSHCLRTLHGELVCTPDTGTFTRGSRRAPGTRRTPANAASGADGGVDGG